MVRGLEEAIEWNESIKEAWGNDHENPNYISADMQIKNYRRILKDSFGISETHMDKRKAAEARQPRISINEVIGSRVVPDQQ